MTSLPLSPSASPLRTAWLDVLWAWVLATGGIWAFSQLPWAWVQPNRGLVAAGLFLYIPLLIVGHRRQTFASFQKPSPLLRRSLLAYVLMSVVVFPLCIAAYYVIRRFQWCAGLHIPSGLVRCVDGPPLALSLQELGLIGVNAFFVAALPEEFFFRGFVQPRFCKVICPYQAILLTSALFALGHVILRGQPAYLLVFFPSVLFGMLRQWTGSIVAGVLFHGSCNVLVHLLRAWFS